MPRDKIPQGATGSSHQRATELDAPKLAVITSLDEGASVTGAASEAGVDRITLHGWLSGDAALIATLDRAKREASDAVRGELLATASDAVKVVRELMTSPYAPPALRLKAALSLLESVGGLEPDPIGPSDPRWARRDGGRRGRPPDLRVYWPEASDLH